MVNTTQGDVKEVVTTNRRPASARTYTWDDDSLGAHA